MVTVIDYVKREAHSGKEFYALVLEGGIEVIKSQSGLHYATTKTTSLPVTFTEERCRELIGEQLPGNISRVEVEPYEFVSSRTGKAMSLSHRNHFMMDEES